MKHVSRMYTRVNILKTLHLVIYFYLFLIQITSSALEKLQLNSTLLVGIYIGIFCFVLFTFFQDVLFIQMFTSLLQIH